MNRQVEFTNKGRYNAICKSADLGPEFDMAEASRYTAVFLTLDVDETFDSEDPTTWKFMVEHITSLAGHSDNWITCELDTARVGTLIGISQLTNSPNLSQVLCAILKDLPESKTPSVGDVIQYSELVSYRDYLAEDRIFNTTFVVQQALPGAGLSGVSWCGQMSIPYWGIDKHLMSFDIFVNYLFSQVMNSAGKTPTSVDVNMQIGPFTFQVKFPFFSPTQE